MEASRRPATRRACDEARLGASLALDGHLDDVGYHHLRRHLESCPDCRAVVAEMQATSTLLRNAPLERFRCELAGARVVRTCSSGLGRHWAGAAVAVLALVLVTGALPRQDDSRPTNRRAVAVAPLTLPIGQRSALDDFTASPAPSTRRVS